MKRGELHGKRESRKSERACENTVMSPLSRGAHGSAVVLIIDVVENLR